MVQEWFSKDLWDQYWANLGVTAENGCFYRWGKATWESLTDELDFSWKERARKLLRMYTDRSGPGDRRRLGSLAACCRVRQGTGVDAARRATRGF